jgi:hypothetical protein
MLMTCARILQVGCIATIKNIQENLSLIKSVVIFGNPVRRQTNE